MKQARLLIGILVFVIFSLLVLRFGPSDVSASSANQELPGGFNIFLPIVMKAPIVVTPPTPVPQGVYVKDNFTVYKEYGYVHVVGEIANFTNNSLFWPKVPINYFDSSNNMFGISSGYTVQDVLLPNETGCFYTIEQDNGAFSYITMEPVSYSTYSYQTYKLAISNPYSYTDSIGYFHITGMLTNNTGGDIEYGKVIATVYSTEGKVIACDIGYSNADIISNGASSGFEILTSIPDGYTLRDFSLATEGMRP